VTEAAAVDDGNPVDRIRRHATSLEADVIVIGTHGQGGFQRFVLGSVAEKVMRKASCPVMTVPPRMMGVQGRSALDMMLFGSTTQEVVRRASCPVLTLRS
jgi:nucleotide-binding universal stress UspA family protein